ncbi:urease accessory protein UreF [Corynebacterium anserum]|uniref:Urease accessory protein UreF n=1 Tax=Corynebacterium anserum TaxID=2684406 RepID=A0A7G7YQA3_9CORY|nr:urease accessory UreF family protein [Corynebacterium anserum]MBC2682353.1 urease accessory protein UreF [Corynebacterium anserum]QNH96673.1 urease accessory protein UreF [Corynebacterium anserum]
MTSLTPLLHAVVYGDSAYPSGRYTLSHGLEGLVQLGRVSGHEQCGQALVDHLRHTATPGDGVATALTVLIAEQAGNDEVKQQEALRFLINLDHELTATKITEALRRASTRVGRQTLGVHGEVSQVDGLLSLYSDATMSRQTPGNQAIVLGLIHHAHGLCAEEAVGVELIGLSVGWSSAALRLRQCDHIRAQAMVARTVPLIDELVKDAVEAARDILDTGDLSQVGRASPGLDLASAEHQFAPARLFMS